jgi:beta-lactamase class A
VRKLQLAVTGLLLLILAIIVFLAYKLYEYDGYREAIYPGVSAAGLSLQGKTREQARQMLEEGIVAPLNKPIALGYEDETVILMPADVGLQIYTDAMVEQAYALGRRDEPDFWQAYVRFVTEGLPRVDEDIPLQYTYQQELMRDFLEEIALEKDEPLREVQPVTDTLSFLPGRPGRRLDIDLSLPRVETTLTSIDERNVSLVVETIEPAKPDIEMLRSMVQHRIDEFAGMVSIYISDPGSDERIEINPDIIYSGMSVVKIGIMLDTLIFLEGQEPDQETQEFLLKVVTDPVGSNYWANQLLGLIGEGSQFEGCRRVDARMKELGLTRTFILEPYRLETEGARRGPGLAKPSFLQGPVSANPDPFIQTSAHDIGALLEMVYDCSQGEGRLLEDYAGRITAEGCQLILDDLKQNPVRTMIGAGIPEDVPLAHKHGFAYDTHADAGVVFSPGGDYILVQFQYAPTDWLVWAISQPVFEDVSRASYNFFNVGQE